MPALVALLALKSGVTKEKSEQFIKEFSKLIFDTLTAGEEVKIKSLGSFRIMNVDTRRSVNISNGEEIIIPEHKRIVFVPSKEIAEIINAPFSMFESVELNPDAELEILSAGDPEKQDDTGEQEILAGVHTVNENQKKEEDPKEEEAVEENTSEKPDAEADDFSADQPDSGEETLTSESDSWEDAEVTEPIIEERPKRGGMKFFWGFICGLLLAMLIVGIGYLFFFQKTGNEKGMSCQTSSVTATDNDSIVAKTVNNSASDTILEEVKVVDEQEVDKEAIENEESIVVSKVDEAAKVATRPSDEIIKDVIGPQNYLTTMAQRHYGNFNLWPIIYEENKKILGHPDRIKPGTAVVIPPLSKYGLDPNNPVDIKKAKQKGLEIYSRYK